jgi:TolB-like protein
MKRIISFLLFLCSFVIAQEKVPVAVLDLEGKGVSELESSTLSDRLRIELFKTKAFEVMERDKMNNILQEQGFQQSGCTSAECAVQIGKLIGVKKIVAGNIGKVGRIWTISLRIIDIETGKIENTAVEDIDAPIEELLIKAIPNIAKNLAGIQAPAPAPAPVAAQPVPEPPKAEPVKKEKEKPAKKKEEGGTSGWVWAGVGAGAVAAGGAVVFFVTRKKGGDQGTIKVVVPDQP